MKQISKIRYEQLQKEKNQLDDSLVHINIEIKEAEKFGDFSENEELHAAKNKKSIILHRLDYINQILQEAEIMPLDDTPIITIGSLIMLEEITKTGVESYGIRMLDDGDVEQGYLDPASPVGKAIKGSPSGEFNVQTSLGILTYKATKLSSSYIDEFINLYNVTEDWDFIE